MLLLPGAWRMAQGILLCILLMFRVAVLSLAYLPQLSVTKFCPVHLRKLLLQVRSYPFDNCLGWTQAFAFSLQNLLRTSVSQTSFVVVC